MGGLFGSLNSSLQALQAFEKALNVSQNNVSNSSTPGYARQTIQLEAQPFDIAGGQAGGVKAGAVQSTDNPYADQAVRDQLAQQGNYNA
jgi:flagellar hook-associated protein 1